MTVIRETSPRRVMSLLVPALICNMLAFTSILPLFPSILQYYSNVGHRDWLYDASIDSLKQFQNFIGVPHNERYDRVFFGGLLGSIFSALQFVSSPTLGRLSDSYGRKNVITICCFLTLVAYLIWLKADTFSLFVLSRIFGGLSKGNINVAVSIVSDIYSPEQHPKGMALIGITYSIGFLIGPMIGAYFSTLFTNNEVFSTPALFSITLTILEMGFLLYLPETLQVAKEKRIPVEVSSLISPNKLFQFDAVKAPINKKLEMQRIGWVYFIYLFLYSGLEFTLPFLTFMKFNYNSMQQGKIYLFTGLLMIILQGGVVRRIPMHRQKKTAEIGISCIIPAYLLVAVANSQLVLYLGLFFYAIASATVVTNLTSLVHCIYPEHEKGILAGIFRSLGCMARALGPIFSSTCFWLLGSSACYSVGAILLFIPLILLKRIDNPASPPKTE